MAPSFPTRILPIETAVAQLKQAPNDQRGWIEVSRTLAQHLMTQPLWEDMHEAARRAARGDMSLKAGMKKAKISAIQEKAWAQLVSNSSEARAVLQREIEIRLEERVSLQVRTLIWLPEERTSTVVEGQSFRLTSVVYLLEDEDKAEFRVLPYPRTVIDVDWVNGIIWLGGDGRWYRMSVVDLIEKVEHETNQDVIDILDVNLRKVAAHGPLLGWHLTDEKLLGKGTKSNAVLRIPFLEQVSPDSIMGEVKSYMPVLEVDAERGKLTTVDQKGRKLVLSLDAKSSVYTCTSKSTPQFETWFEDIKQQLARATDKKEKARLTAITKSPNKFWGAHCFQAELLPTERVRALNLHPLVEVSQKYADDVQALEKAGLFGRLGTIDTQKLQALPAQQAPEARGGEITFDSGLFLTGLHLLVSLGGFKGGREEEGGAQARRSTRRPARPRNRALSSASSPSSVRRRRQRSTPWFVQE